MSKKQKKILIRIIISAVLTALAVALPVKGLLKLCLFLIPYLIIGYDILASAFWGVIHGNMLDENFLMAAATVGAFILGYLKTDDYFESVAVMLFYQIGEWFSRQSVEKSRKNVSALLSLRPDTASLETAEGVKEVFPEEVSIGEIILVRAGERVPIDGIIAEGNSTIDTSALSGESMPIDISQGEEILSGSINLVSPLKIKTTKLFEESAISKILELIENASSNKSKSEKFISKFARIYTPSVCISAIILGLLPPIAGLLSGGVANFIEWISRALTFLVISCPCALVVSIPLSFFASIGGAGKKGILVKGSNYIETISKIDTLVFDKTGTVTSGEFGVSEIYSKNLPKDELISLLLSVESASNHPIAKSILSCYRDIKFIPAQSVKEIHGKGLIAEIKGKSVAIGNAMLMKEMGINTEPPKKGGTVLYAASNGELLGYIRISDSVKREAQESLAELKKLGIKRIIMLTGDSQASAQEVADKLGIDNYYHSLLPDGKAEKLTDILGSKEGTVAFIGDGINDAPSLSLADVGISMGIKGSDAAIEASDAVLMKDDLRGLPILIKASKKCMRIVKENIIFAIGVKFLCLILSALGYANMGLAIFADVGVMVLAVLNSMRGLKIKKD